MEFPLLTAKEKVTRWYLQLHLDEKAPCITIKEVNDKFLDWLYQNYLEVYDEKSFRKSVCEALCTLKENYDRFNVEDLEMVKVPDRKTNNPDWKDDFNEKWDAYVQSIYTTDVINNLFDSIEVALWEDSLSTWRYVIGSILPYYIKPSIEALEHEGYIVRDESEELITCEDATEEQEYNEYYY